LSRAGLLAGIIARDKPVGGWVGGRAGFPVYNGRATAAGTK